MKRVILLLSAIVLIGLFTPSSAKADDLWGCFNCDYTYEMFGGAWDAHCVFPYSGDWGQGIQCSIRPFGNSSYCRITGGACLYLVVDGLTVQSKSSPQHKPKTAGPVKDEVQLF
jgi:hypothetical protein